MAEAGPDRETLRRVVRQHADTARSMGVDFVPCFRTGVVVEPKAAGVVEEDSPAVAAPAKAPEPVKAAESFSEDERAARQARLDEIRARYEADAPHKDFDTEFTNIVFGEGDPCARLMFIGEAPGAEEDKTGRPFVGRAGQLLEKMIIAMGLSRETVYIANLLKTRPPNNRTPTPDEVRACAPYLYEQVRVIRPAAIVTLGAPASKLLLETDQGIGKLRGTWATFPPATALVAVEDVPETPVMPTYHPAFLLRSYTDENRRKVWSDLRQVMDRLGLTAAG